jgi:hypothetical protein
MKKIILLAAFCAATLMVNAGDEPKNKMHGEKYCTKMENGALKVMHEGKEITADVMLEDGSTIKPNGMHVMKDGTSHMMKEGQCVDKKGKMHETMKSEEKKAEHKMKKEEKKVEHKIDK